MSLPEGFECSETRGSSATYGTTSQRTPSHTLNIWSSRQWIDGGVWDWPAAADEVDIGEWCPTPKLLSSEDVIQGVKDAGQSLRSDDNSGVCDLRTTMRLPEPDGVASSHTGESNTDGTTEALSDEALDELDKQMGFGYQSKEAHTLPVPLADASALSIYGTLTVSDSFESTPTQQPIRLKPYETPNAYGSFRVPSIIPIGPAVAPSIELFDPRLLDSFANKPQASPATTATPCTADLRLIGRTVITCEELLAYLPRHLSTEAVLRRLYGNGWERADICAAVNYFRDWTMKGEALMTNTITHKLLAMEKRHNGGHCLSQAQRDTFYPTVWDFTAQAWAASDPRRRQTNNLLADLAKGVVRSRRPRGAGAGPLSRCIEYAEQHPKLGLRLSDVQQITVQQLYATLETSLRNIDLEAWERMHDVLQIRKYRYPGGDAGGKSKETSKYQSARRREVEKKIDEEIKARKRSKGPQQAARNRYAPY